MLPTSAGVEPATSWSPVGRRIQLSHRGRQFVCVAYMHTRMCALRKHAYSNILKILPPKNEIFQIKNSDIFLISRRGGSNEYP